MRRPKAALAPAERHRRARRLREADRRQASLLEAAAEEFEAPCVDEVADRPPRDEETGLFASIRRAIRRPRSGEENHDDRIPPVAPEPAGETAGPVHDDDRYANAVAAAVRMASGDRMQRHADTMTADQTVETESETEMYPYPPHYPAYPGQEPSNRQDQPLQYPQAPMMQPVAVWPTQPVVGWPAMPQAQGGPYGAPPMPYPAYGWPSMPPMPQQMAPAAQWPEPQPRGEPAPSRREEQELEDLRESVRALRETVEALMHRRWERDSRTG